MWKLMNYEKIYDYGTHKKEGKYKMVQFLKLLLIS
jgi:hypothetical protein